MKPLNYEGVYGDTLADSLEAELSSIIAEALYSDDTFTQQLKRKLLVATADSTTRRETFFAALEAEWVALDWYDAELENIESTLVSVP